MDSIDTIFGTVSGLADCEMYPDGTVKSCRLAAENHLQTPLGEVIPLYSAAEPGERNKKDRRSLAFFENGRIKSIALDQSMPLQTPLGIINAEAVTFYENGVINRLFPLNGQIDGYWSERKEAELAVPMDFDLPVGKFSAKVISFHFFPSGALKSLTLWPSERITIQSPLGPVRVRKGFSLYESGALRSFEPAKVEDVSTPIGLVKAFDAEMIGMNADVNSIQFTPEGLLSSLKTIHTGLRVTPASGTETLIEPFETISRIDDQGGRTVPMQIDFGPAALKVVAQRTHHLDLAQCKVATFARARVIREACSSCAGCEGGESCCQN